MSTSLLELDLTIKITCLFLDKFYKGRWMDANIFLTVFIFKWFEVTEPYFKWNYVNFHFSCQQDRLKCYMLGDILLSLLLG